MKRHWIVSRVAATAGIAAVSVTVVFAPFIWSFVNQGAKRDALLSLESSIDIGMEEGRVRAIIGRAAEQNDLRPVFRSPHLLEVRTPILFGARNWVLVVALERGVVCGTGIRTEDNLRDRPLSAPRDRGTLPPEAKPWSR
jgi:hypothetical protein